MNQYPHMCRMDHQEIGHSDSEHEQCPLCRANDRIEELDRKYYTAIGYYRGLDSERNKLQRKYDALVDGIRRITTTCPCAQCKKLRALLKETDDE